MKKVYIQVSDMNEISNAIEKINEVFLKFKVNKTNAMFSCMAIEDVLAELIKAKKPESTVKIAISKFINSIKVTIVSEGKEVDLKTIYCNQFAKKITEVSKDENIQDYAIRNAIMNASEKNFKSTYKNGSNIAFFKINIGMQKNLLYMLLAIVLGTILGFVLKIDSLSNIANFLDKNIFDSVSTIFFNSLEIVIGPLVFFSIASSISTFGDIKRIGRIGGKIMLGYTFTSIIAVLIGFTLIKATGLKMNNVENLVVAESTVEVVETSIKDTIINIVPSNFLAPFIEGNMLQILFIAFVVGITISALNEYKEILITFVNACNGLLETITQAIIEVMPIAIFCIIASLIYNLGIGTLTSLIPCVVAILIAFVLLIIVYSLIILIFAKENPFRYFKKMMPSMMTAFSTRSSGATIPVTMDCCDKAGISPSLYSFSIPFGATINMDATCTLLIVGTMFFINSFGVPLTTMNIITLLFTTVVFSMSAPGMPGSSIAFFTLLALQFGLPTAATALFIPISTFVDPFSTVINVTGDSSITLAVAKKEKMIDTEKLKQ
ncbi:MAG: dicarboxylate/amino acid:cation symporter [Clostridia bacterium]|nr:dicarboxylate/amino acid:cation symporter [Clostridia bacterium]